MLPVVLFDRDICNKDNSQIVMDAVVNDNFNGAYDMVSHLLSLGHRNIAILSGNKDQPHMNLRVDGYCKALQDNNIPVNPDFILKSELTFEKGYEKTKELFSRSFKPSAYFVLNNTAALGAVFALNELHIQIPQDISICAFGEFKYHAILNPDLTVVNQHPYEYGKKAAKVLIDKINCAEHWKPVKVVMPSDIVLRDSCAPVK
jgi:LacI family transcriptional regulator